MAMKYLALALIFLPGLALADQDSDDLAAALTGYAYAAKLKAVAQGDVARAESPDQTAAAQSELTEAQAEHDRAYTVASALATRSPLSTNGISAASLIIANAF